MRLIFIETKKMKTFTITTIMLGVLFFLGGCSTEVDMYADYKDITIVYGVADYTDDTTWIKVTKAFSGPGNALLIAQNADSSNYPYKLNVQLTGTKSGGDVLPSIVLDTITIHNKNLTEYFIGDDGDTVVLNPFYSPDQLMYYTTEPLDADYTYQLTIDNNGELIQGETPMIDHFTVSKPSNRITFPTNPGIADPKVEWDSEKNAKRYEVSLTFNYKEMAPGTQDTVYKSIDWFLGTRKSKTLAGGESMEISYSGANFFVLLQNQLEPIPNVKRWAGLVDVHIAAGSQVLETFLEINGSTGSLLEEVPAYSNMDGAIGIFASRHNAIKSLQLSSATETELVTQYDFGFILPQ